MGVTLIGGWNQELERAELTALNRRYDGIVHQFRLAALGRRLNQPLAVRHNTCGFAGDRWTIELDDHSVLRMKLYWPRYAVVSALCSLGWVDDEGWRAVVRTAGGEQVLLRAFNATLTPARGQASQARLQPN